MALEALAWPQPPTFLDLEDGVSYNLGVRFQVTEALNCVGISWSPVPTATPAPAGGTHVASIWSEDDVRLASADFTPIPGAGEQQISFAAPLALLPGVDYIAAVHTVHYVFRASGGVYPTSPSGKIVANIGRLAVSNAGPLVAPAGSSSGLFYVGPLVDLGGAPDPEIHTTTGTAALVITATAIRATARPATGAATLAATATAARSTARIQAGAAALAVTAAASRSTARATAARAALAITATAVTPEQHTTTGRGTCVATARATSTTARGTSGAAPVYLTARRVPPTGPGAGPRLASASRLDRLVSASRSGVIVTSTRG